MKQQSKELKTIKDYVYSSEMKTRQKFSIKDLIGQQPGLERNYASQQSQRFLRSTGRPQTMYGQRIRILLNQQTKRTKMQTQIKSRRLQSSYKVARSSSGVEVKIVTEQDKIKMKKALGKVNILASRETLNVEQQQQIQAIFQFLSCLAQVNNHYQIAFKYILEKLRQLVFANNKSQLGLSVNKLANRCKNQFLSNNVYNQVNFIHRNIGKITFQSLCQQLLKETDLSVLRMEQAQRKQMNNEQKYKETIKQKQELIKKLKRELKYYQQHPSQDLYPYVKKIQREHHQMKQQVEELLRAKRQNQYSIQIYETTNLLMAQQIQALKAKIYQIELQQLSGLKQVQKNSQLKIFEQNVDNLKQMLDKSKLKMQGMKQQFDKIKAHNEQLINERAILAKRAAVGFGQLTPRPNVKNIFNQNGLVYQNFINLSKKNTSTQNIVECLVQKMKKVNLNQLKTNTLQKKQYRQNSDQQSQGMQEAIKYIDQTKAQVLKTLKSVQEVKKSFNKQNTDRQNLQKAQGKK